MNRWIFALAALAVPVVAACTVGGAGSAYFIGQDDPSPGTREAPSNTADRPPNAGRTGGSSSGASSSSGSSGACPAGCTGRFDCTDNEGKKSTITFREKDGACDGSGLKLSCDGKLTAGGQVAGSWSASGSGFTVSAGNATLTCVTSQGGEDIPTAPPPATGTATATPPPPTPPPPQG